LASWSAMALPIPLPAPVTKATFLITFILHILLNYDFF
jgi:hypothetical protein